MKGEGMRYMKIQQKLNERRNEIAARVGMVVLPRSRIVT